jgi:spore germination cell wall hydrolase CwlJ-like protein
VRIRLLIFLLPVLASGPTPAHAALGDAPRCIPLMASQRGMESTNANLPIPEDRHTTSYDSEERDYLIRTIAFEASGEPEEGQTAVAHVVLNRQRSGRWGESIKEVVTHPWQFEPWMTKRAEMESLSPNDLRYQSAAKIADAVLSGQTPDPTAGATHFLNPTIVRERRGGSLPAWAHGHAQPIGRHTFYLPEDETGYLPQTGGGSMSAGIGDADFVRTSKDDGEPPLECEQQTVATKASSVPVDDLVQLNVYH